MQKGLNGVKRRRHNIPLCRECITDNSVPFKFVYAAGF